MMTMVMIAEKLKEKPKSAKGSCGMLNHLALLTAEKSNTPIAFAEIQPTINATMTEMMRKMEPLLRNREPRMTKIMSTAPEIRASSTFWLIVASLAP